MMIAMLPVVIQRGMAGNGFNNFHAWCDPATKATGTYSRLREISCLFCILGNVAKLGNTTPAENYAPIARRRLLEAMCSGRTNNHRR
ncbi:hypothetical protein F4804DRAFT_325818 [Jackrogersella minutella]|nr:hypothetical protein F4804DRAFT_325818 [Jackrogersella minutella]